MDSGPRNEGAAGPSGTAGDRGGQSGEGSSGTGVVSGTSGTGASGSGTSGVGGMSATGGNNPPPPPPLLANGESCSDDARCKSKHCDGICCDIGAKCCKMDTDCPTQPGGFGMSCDDRATCRGSAGTIMCTPEFKCVTMNGVRNDMACSNRVEANDCGFYPSVFCRGGEMQSGAPGCATSCASDAECDLDAHCAEGKCIGDLANGEPCKLGTDCTQGFCKNPKNGVGVCCGLLADCCKAPTDCPDVYRQAPKCDNATCSGTELVAQCNGNICNSSTVMNDAACSGKPGPNCGSYKDIICMPGRNNQCKNSCANVGDCDDNAFCDAAKCIPKRANGETCSMMGQCISGNCMNSVCCSANGECCKTADQCIKSVDLKCDNDMTCQGSRRMATCQNSLCMYPPTRIEDDSACKAGMGGNSCGAFKDLVCNGTAIQNSCMVTCTKIEDCDSGFVCASDGGQRKCLMPGGMSGAAADGAAGASSGSGI